MSIGKLVALIFVGFCATSGAQGACPRYTAPSQFDNAPVQWGNDTGPIVNGFIDSKRPTGGLFDLVHGVDLDSYNAVDHAQIAGCGGKFAIVRINRHANGKDTLDTLFNKNIDGLNAQNVSAFPYFFFNLPPDLKTIAKFNNKLSAADEAQYRASYANAGSTAAQHFFDLLAQARYNVPSTNIAGLGGQFISVDVEQTPTDAKQANNTAKAYYGTFYAQAVCSWIRAVARSQNQLIPVLYTFPAIYAEYLQFADADANACLEGLPVWIARTYPNGWEAIQQTDLAHCHGSVALCTTDRYVQKLCEIQGGNRCIIHQYTHRGTAIAIGATGKNKIPPHVDMDRFYTSKTVPNGVGTQYVRVEDAFN
jgi:hypothetical protein